MPILKFLWLALRPISKAESTYGWWELMNLITPIAYFVLPKLELWASNFNFVWFAGIPALLFLIAGIKLQFRLAGIERGYRYSLSLGDDFDPDWVGNKLTLYLSFSNAINKPVEYELLANKTYIEIEGMARVFKKENVKDVIPAFQKTKCALPEVTSPETYPCQGKLHYELLYGYPGKALFRHTKEFELKFNIIWTPQKEMMIRGHSVLDEDMPIKKREFDKEDFQT